MAWVFDTHPADSRVVGPVKVAGCVVARYGAGGGQHAGGSGYFVQGQHAVRCRKHDEHGNNDNDRPRQNDHSTQKRSCGHTREHH